jgi:hypothetical protein
MSDFDADLPLRIRAIDAQLEQSEQKAVILLTIVSLLLAAVIGCSVFLGVWP